MSEKKYNFVDSLKYLVDKKDHDTFHALALERIEELESKLRFCAEYISTTEGFTDWHPVSVLEWIDSEYHNLKEPSE